MKILLVNIISTMKVPAHCLVTMIHSTEDTSGVQNENCKTIESVKLVNLRTIDKPELLTNNKVEHKRADTVQITEEDINKPLKSNYLELTGLRKMFYLSQPKLHIIRIK